MVAFVKKIKKFTMKNSIVKYVKKCPEHPKPLNELQGQMENKRVCKQVIYYDYI